VDLTVWLAVSAWRRCSSALSAQGVYGLGFLVLYPIIAYFLLHGGISA
jgi:general L-amino acid transport system permease protein